MPGQISIRLAAVAASGEDLNSAARRMAQNFMRRFAWKIRPWRSRATGYCWFEATPGTLPVA